MTEGLFFLISHQYNPSVSFADSSPYTGEPSAVAGTVQSEGFLEPPALLVVFIIQKEGAPNAYAFETPSLDHFKKVL